MTIAQYLIILIPHVPRHSCTKMILPIPSRQLVIVFWLFPLLVSSTTTGTTTSGPKEGSAASRLTTGGAEGAGAPCLIDADCSTGLSCYCPDRQFQQEGTGADSDAAAATIVVAVVDASE